MKELFFNHYKHCETEWGEAADCTCNDRCPVCNKEIEPFDSIDLRKPEIPKKVSLPATFSSLAMIFESTVFIEVNGSFDRRPGIIRGRGTNEIFVEFEDESASIKLSNITKFVSFDPTWGAMTWT